MADTFAAIATAPGEAGIGIVRVSGPEALRVFRAVYLECPEQVMPRHVYYGHAVRPDGSVIDEMVCFYTKAPHTYTGEDCVEFQAHGSDVSLRAILRSTLAAGARLADPGEFTKTAFLHGKMDLSQAEAVIELIRAKSELPLSIASSQLGGHLRDEVRLLRDRLRDVLAEMAVNIDFPDEDIEQIAFDAFGSSLRGILTETDELLATSDTGRMARSGIRVAIVGKPNVGKSSLMNALLGDDRAIVTDIPGTTRDTISEWSQVEGIPLVLVDTAGIRETADTIEQIGIERSRSEMERADLILFVLDRSVPLTDEDREIARTVRDSEKSAIIILNKEDLEGVVSTEEAQALVPEASVLELSMRDRRGGKEAAEAISNLFFEKKLESTHGSIIMNERHRDALVRAVSSLRDSLSMLERAEALELTELEVHAAYDALGEITGDTAGEEILDTVFAKFCLGK